MRLGQASANSLDHVEWRAAIDADTRAVFCESISNPTLEVIDLKAVCDIAHEAGALVVVDNVFATPIHSYAREAGADLVVYSTTKHIDGQGRSLGGVILGVAETFAAAYISSEYKDIVAFGLLVLILLVRPTGLLGKPEVEKV